MLDMQSRFFQHRMHLGEKCLILRSGCLNVSTLAIAMSTGKPMAIQQHADIISVSYEARKMGVTKHMPTRTIRQQYPSVKLVHVQVNLRNYLQQTTL